MHLTRMALTSLGCFEPRGKYILCLYAMIGVRIQYP